MTPELTALAYAALFQGLHFAVLSALAYFELGGGKLVAPRDPERLGKPLAEHVSVRTGRLFRAMNNHFEALILFTAAVAVVSLADKNTGFSAICAYAYLGARVLYVPAYYFGLTPWRTLIWFVGFTATMLMLLSALM